MDFLHVWMRNAVNELKELAVNTFLDHEGHRG